MFIHEEHYGMCIWKTVDIIKCIKDFIKDNSEMINKYPMLLEESFLYDGKLIVDFEF